GFVPAMVAAIVRRNMSEKEAFAMLTLGKEMDAAQLKDIGVVHHIFSEDDLENETLKFAEQYSKLSGSAVQMTKQLLYGIDGLTFEEAIEQGAQINAQARMTEDCQNGIARFLEKK